MYATLLNAISSSANFVLYCLLSQRFHSHLKHLLTGKTRQGNNNIKSHVSYVVRVKSSDIEINNFECTNVKYF